MPYIAAILIPLGLLALFLGLVAVEERRGARLVLPAARYRLDAKVARVTFVVKHVDWGAFLNDVARSGTERALHDIAHASLMIVRALERTLTRTVRTLRARRDTPVLPPAERPSRIAAAVTYLRTSVRRARKEPAQPTLADTLEIETGE